MHEQEPEFYTLEFQGDATFWTEGDTSTRRTTYIVPLPKAPREFVAFGVLDDLKRVLFAARGSVREHLGTFIARMKEAGAEVKLCARPPLPDHIWKPYTKGDDYEHTETEAPPPPPEGPGMKGPDSDALLGFSSEAGLWPEGEGGAVRQAICVPLYGFKEFLAFGVLRRPDETSQHLRVPFVARGSMRDDIRHFVARMLVDCPRNLST